MGVSDYSRQEFINTLEYLIPKITTDLQLKELVMNGGYAMTAINYDSDKVITTASVIWPDGSAGVFTTTVKNTEFLEVDAFTITHVDSGKTVTQPAVTRDSDGDWTAIPVPIVS